MGQACHWSKKPCLMSNPRPLDPGWRVFPEDPGLLDWLRHARRYAEDPQETRNDGTWAPGVDVLPNDAEGRVDGGPPLHCDAFEVAGRLPLHRGQVSVTYPGFPGRDPGESAAAHRFRRDRDAAHLDGLLPIGPERRRMIREPHAWILGLPLTPMHDANAPLVVWEGSHDILCKALQTALAPYPPKTWPDVDVTQAYQAARKACFETCKRVEVTAMPGQAILLHRLILHGVAPWRGPAGLPRAVVYFRPLHPGGVGEWLNAP